MKRRVWTTHGQLVFFDAMLPYLLAAMPTALEKEIKNCKTSFLCSKASGRKLAVYAVEKEKSLDIDNDSGRFVEVTEKD